jgi:hypothetical protein
VSKDVFSKAASAVITVGDGRGFVVGNHVITAAHCLPDFPASHGASFDEERTYEKLLGPLGKEPSVSAECLFADPVGDIAVLGAPDNQDYREQAEAYEKLVETVKPLRVAAPGEEGWLLSLDGSWFRCRLEHQKFGPLWFRGLEGKIVGGMSGSPVLSANGKAVGVVCLGGSDRPAQVDFHGPNPSLIRPSRLVWEEEKLMNHA